MPSLCGLRDSETPRLRDSETPRLRARNRRVNSPGRVRLGSEVARLADTGFAPRTKEVVLVYHEAAALTAPTVSLPASPIAALVAFFVRTKAQSFPLNNWLHMGGMDDSVLASNNFGLRPFKRSCSSLNTAHVQSLLAFLHSTPLGIGGGGWGGRGGGGGGGG